MKKRFILLMLLAIGSTTVCQTVFAQATNTYIISNYVSHPMTYQSDSEAQTASDLAAFYGYSVDAMAILNLLPLSDDPNNGFVGYYDEAASLPPNTYGVYQEPVAAALRSLFIPAQGLENITLDTLKSFLLEGKPVMCWVVGQTGSGSTMQYTPSNGRSVTVAAGMNTVTVYGIDTAFVYIADNGKTYTRSYAEFELSWAILGRRALVIDTFSLGSGQFSITPMEQSESWNSNSWDNNNWGETWNEWEQDNSITGWGDDWASGNYAIPEVTPDFTWQDEPDNSYSYDGYSNWNNQNNYPSQTFDYNDFFDPAWLPASAVVSGFNGKAQTYTLDCETRSAIDLAAFFGVTIDHSTFLNSLPKSDDPNVGFVGNFNDPRGRIPPASYGVYQEPIAAMLRAYGLSATGYKNYTWDQIRFAVADDRPVMVWVISNTEPGAAVPYTPPSTGQTTLVAPYQHTAVIIGYDSENVSFQDGGLRYQRTIEEFLTSWAVLENRAIVIN